VRISQKGTKDTKEEFTTEARRDGGEKRGRMGYREGHEGHEGRIYHGGAEGRRREEGEEWVTAKGTKDTKEEFTTEARRDGGEKRGRKGYREGHEGHEGRIYHGGAEGRRREEGKTRVKIRVKTRGGERFTTKDTKDTKGLAGMGLMIKRGRRG
jgi:hypothetical protein